MQKAGFAIVLFLFCTSPVRLQAEMVVFGFGEATLLVRGSSSQFKADNPRLHPSADLAASVPGVSSTFSYNLDQFAHRSNLDIQFSERYQDAHSGPSQVQSHLEIYFLLHPIQHMTSPGFLTCRMRPTGGRLWLQD